MKNEIVLPNELSEVLDNSSITDLTKAQTIAINYAPMMESVTIQMDLFTVAPKLKLEFNEKPIVFGDLGTMKEKHQDKKTVQTAHKYWNECKKGYSFSTVSGGSFFNWCRLDENKVAPTMHTETRMMYHPDIMRPVNEKECKLISTFPIDYNFTETNYSIFVGMSVPPVMTAQIATEIYNQWLNKL